MPVATESSHAIAHASSDEEALSDGETPSNADLSSDEEASINAEAAAAAEAPFTPKKRYLDRDTRLKILTLRDIGWQYLRIANHLNVTVRQVQVAVNAGHPTPSKRTGRKARYSSPERREIVDYVCSNKATRRLTYAELADLFDSSIDRIKLALRKEGYSRRVARSKPPITEVNRLKRLAWATEHLNWTREQWNTILWSDETWATGKKHTRTWVTRRSGEALHPDCVQEKIQRYRGWMFWGCFSGAAGKGPGLFWEKEWGSINKESYCERIVPIVDGWMRLHPGQLFMQDHAPGHRAAYTREEMNARGIRVIDWPPFSPDLNPIEAVWNMMKDYLMNNFDTGNVSYTRLREMVLEAWNSITNQDLQDLLDTMHDRCQAVIDANGMYIEY